MNLLEAQQVALDKDPLYNIIYRILPIESNRYMIERMFVYNITNPSKTQIPESKNNDKNSYIIELTIEELELVKRNLEQIFKFLELRYHNRNLWFRQKRVGQNAVWEFELTTDVREIIRWMNVLLYIDTHIISDDGTELEIYTDWASSLKV